MATDEVSFSSKSLPEFKAEKAPLEVTDPNDPEVSQPQIRTPLLWLIITTNPALR
jgi:hypothetical protein